MLSYKFDIVEALKNAGLTQTKNRKKGIFSQSTMSKFKKGDASITIENLNKLCCILEMQPRDILKYTETETDKKNILEKI